MSLTTTTMTKSAPSTIASSVFSRKYIPNDEVGRAPLITTGVERYISLTVYSLIVLGAFSGVMYTGYHDFNLMMVSLAVAYFANNLGFAIGHTLLHMEYIEQPEQEMYILTHHSFIHHYRDIQIYHKTWLETRLAFFFDGRKVLEGVIGSQTLNWFGLVPFMGTMLSPSSLHFISSVSSFFLIELLQAICHEWYHVPQTKRKHFYWAPTFYTLSFLELIGILDTVGHKKHHTHNLDNLDDVHNWTDMYSIGFETIADWIFTKMKAHYVPGEQRMSETMKPIAAMTAVAMNLILQVGAWLHYMSFMKVY